MEMFSSQPALVIAQPKAAEDAADTEPGLEMPQMINPTMSTAVTPKMTLSKPKRLRCSSTPMPGTNPGCISWGYRPTAVGLSVLCKDAWYASWEADTLNSSK